MKPTLTLLLAICVFFISCNISANSNNAISAKDKFLGTWVFLKPVAKSSKNDNSMDGLTCKISLAEGTKESYSVDISRFQGTLFTKKDDSTLTAIGADIKIRYIESNQHMIFELDPEDGYEFYKLK